MAGFKAYDLTYDIQTGLLSGDDVDFAKLVQCGGNVYLTNNKYEKEEVNEEKIGKWMLFPPKESDVLEKIWKRVNEAVKAGNLWKVKFSLMDPSKFVKNGENCAVIIYTKDYENVEDVVEVLDFLETSGIKDPGEEIKYKTDKHTKAGIYSGGFKFFLTIYSSKTIRTWPFYIPDMSSQTIFEYDIEKKNITSECKIQPSDNSHPEFKWICARNNKYHPSEISQDALGKWMIFLDTASIDLAWIKIKRAIMEGNLWYVIVSTANDMIEENKHAVFVFTKDYSNVDDVIEVLDYLEISEIKPPNTAIVYKSNFQNASSKNFWYSSDNIRNKYTY